MCGQSRSRVGGRALGAAFTLLLVAVPSHGCQRGAKSSTEANAPRTSSSETRAARRAYDGAPPVIPHADVGATCIECHNEVGRQVEGLGFSPPTPHRRTPGVGVYANCRQCHVARKTADVFVASAFKGLPQDLRQGRRASPGAPPVMPHPRFMRENCAACHTGPAARASIRTSHPERVRCEQCHVEQRSTTTFAGTP